MEVEKIAADRYRLRSHGHIMTLNAQDMLTIMDYSLRWAKQLEAEARAAEFEEHKRNARLDAGEE